MSEAARTIALHLPAARRGDVAAFTELVRATQSTVSAIALAVVRDVQHSEDVAQEAYLRVWRKLGELKNPDSFLPWLRQVTRNLARDHLRRMRARPGDQPGNQDVLRSIATDDEGAARATAREVEFAALNKAFDRLPAEAREVLALYYREGRSAESVASLLGLSPAAVRQRLSRARKRLRDDLEKRLASTVIASAPGAAFTAAVGALLAGASPPAAAAVFGGLGVKAGAKVIGGAGLGIVLALLGGIAGVVLGIRPYLRTATNPAERTALLRQRNIGIAMVVLAVAGFLASAVLPGWQPAALVYALFMIGLFWHTQIALPRILAQRLAAERARDPVAARRQRRQRMIGWIGFIGGGLAGGTGLLFGLISSGRLG